MMCSLCDRSVSDWREVITSLSFWFAFLWYLATLSTFSCTCWPPVCLLWNLCLLRVQTLVLKVIIDDIPGLVPTTFFTVFYCCPWSAFLFIFYSFSTFCGFNWPFTKVLFSFLSWHIGYTSFLFFLSGWFVLDLQYICVTNPSPFWNIPYHSWILWVSYNKKITLIPSSLYLCCH